MHLKPLSTYSLGSLCVSEPKKLHIPLNFMMHFEYSGETTYSVPSSVPKSCLVLEASKLILRLQRKMFQIAYASH